ncbi:DUF4954 domain-containing protein [Tannerella serpentiformis]|uniref:DUF4954 family protein n=1 Tax=Tannerella serpentiformis TaxID=712710 RepID=UPI000840B863|nr:DUF4954 family protein [Tannerella serpentiformis]AOH41748.1 DUF4954 domain-containing protein [Tannerella serpentiformis]AVV53480.1 DUF4954 domain-containing protein [Tannerella serpentiformis]
MPYRKLTQCEIDALVASGCEAEDWQRVEVADVGFDPTRLRHVRFSGQISLGSAVDLRDATICDCMVGDGVRINGVRSALAGYEIGRGARLTDIGTMTYRAGTTAGNGVRVAAVNENGGRAVPLFDGLTAQTAHLMVFHRHRTETLRRTFDRIDAYAATIAAAPRGYVGEGATVEGCGRIVDVRIGDRATVCGATLLQNGTILSQPEAPTEVGVGVMARDFILAPGARVVDGAFIERCFVGEACLVEQGFTAIDCLLFANGMFAKGEAVSVFAAPHTVSHHKSSLSIACSLSFANMGSGSNMSNHAYKLGAVHQSVAERGTKFGSNSYVQAPAHFGAYSMITGEHRNHPDTHALPFSYLMDEDGQSMLIPAVNLFRTGTLRDATKWPNRDHRTADSPRDLIRYDFLNPDLIDRILAAVNLLSRLKEEKPDAKYYTFGNCSIHRHSLQKGITYYREALDIFVGDYLVCGGTIDDSEGPGRGPWIDLSGLVMPHETLEEIVHDDLFGADAAFRQAHARYEEYLGRYVTDRYDLSDADKRREHLKRYVSTLDTVRHRLSKEAALEYFGVSQISYGADCPESDRQTDFLQVRGEIATDPFLAPLLSEMEHKAEQARAML